MRTNHSERMKRINSLFFGSVAVIGSRVSFRYEFPADFRIMGQRRIQINYIIDFFLIGKLFY